MESFADDEIIMKDVLWAMRYLLKDNSYDWLQEKGAFLFKYFQKEHEDTLLPCLKIILDISSGTEELTDVSFSSDFVGE